MGLILALCSAYIIARIQNKAGQTAAVKKQNKKAVASFYDYLKFNENNAELFAQLYRYFDYDVEIIDYDSFAASKDGIKTYVTLLYRQDAVNSNDVACATVTAKRIGANKARIFAAKIDSVALKNAQSRFDVSFADVNGAYELFVQADKLPNIPDVKPLKSSFAAKYAFCRKRAGWYFAGSVFSALLSIVAYFPYYTLGWATVLLAFALYSAFNTRYNVKPLPLKLD